MTHANIRIASNNGYSNWEILAMLINDGAEYPDAVAKVAAALRLPRDEVKTMEQNYDEVC